MWDQAKQFKSQLESFKHNESIKWSEYVESKIDEEMLKKKVELLHL